jgi:hypothetical protein
MLYYATKRCHLDFETSGVCYLQVLQAEIVNALYEMLHAIHPAAFLSIGRGVFIYRGLCTLCSRSGHQSIEIAKHTKYAYLGRS